MLPHLLTNFQIQKYYQKETRFNGVYSRDNPTEIKYGPYIIDLDDTLILELIGLLCMFIMMMLLILILLVQNIFRKKLKHLLIVLYLFPSSSALRNNKYFQNTSI